LIPRIFQLFHGAVPVVDHPEEELLEDAHIIRDGVLFEWFFALTGPFLDIGDSFVNVCDCEICIGWHEPPPPHKMKD
jgi:hypothetical protein